MATSRVVAVVVAIVIVVISIVCYLLIWNASTRIWNFENEDSTIDIEEQSRLHVTYKSRTSLEGDNVTFTCKISTGISSYNDPYDVKWFKSGIPIFTNTSQTSRLTPKGLTLKITHLQKSDSGLYECQVTFTETGISERESVQFLVQGPARVTHVSKLYFKRGASAIVPCHVDANPPVQFVLWEKDQRLIEPDESLGYSFAPNGSLLINVVKDSDVGLYTCTPYNNHGTMGSSPEFQVVLIDQ